MSVILIGMQGSGKTTVMNTFERIYGYSTADVDSWIEREYGTISEIFSDYGEAYFRDIETETIKKIFNDGVNAAVVSTGGGSVLREENVRIFKKNGKIVYLRATLDTLIARLEGDRTRPLLKGDINERLTKLMNERSELYERVADVIIDTDDLTPEQILAKIFK